MILKLETSFFKASISPKICRCRLESADDVKSFTKYSSCLKKIDICSLSLKFSGIKLVKHGILLKQRLMPSKIEVEEIFANAIGILVIFFTLRLIKCDESPLRKVINNRLRITFLYLRVSSSVV